MLFFYTFIDQYISSLCKAEKFLAKKLDYYNYSHEKSKQIGVKLIEKKGLV